MLRICEATDDLQAIAQPEIRSLISFPVFSHNKYTKFARQLHDESEVYLCL